MAVDSAEGAGAASAWETVRALVAADGSATHPLVTRLSQPRAAIRDVTDLVHSLCALHGSHPGVIDLAGERAEPAFAEWLGDAGRTFAVERALLARLVAAAGPLPSTPGQAMSEAAILGQRHALAMLARSDRQGCALGAAAALALDWSAVHGLLSATAERFGLTPPEPYHVHLPDIAAAPAPLARALAFGAQQLLAQHRGLWDLLEARASARDAL